MKVMVEAKYLHGLKTGLGQYASNMVRSLYQLKPKDYHMVVTTDRRVPPEVVSSGISQLVIPGRDRTRVFREQVEIPLVALVRRVNVIYSLATPIPTFLKFCPEIMTVHDVFRLRVKTDAHNGYWERYLISSVHRAEYVIAVSEFTKRELCELLDVDPCKVVVIYPAPSEEIVIVDRLVANTTVRGLGITRPYLLTRADMSPRKRLDILLDALPMVEPTVDLVVVGPQPDQEKLSLEIEKRGISNRVHVLGYVDAHTLSSLFCAAEVFVLPSVYEGFGLPVAEAFKVGTPVVAFETASIPEVSAGAALLAKTISPECLATCINEVLTNPDLRLHMVTNGFRRAREFSWSKAALAVWKLISDLA